MSRCDENISIWCVLISTVNSFATLYMHISILEPTQIKWLSIQPVAPSGQTSRFTLAQAFENLSYNLPTPQLQFGNMPGPSAGHCPSKSLKSLAHLWTSFFVNRILSEMKMIIVSLKSHTNCKWHRIWHHLYIYTVDIGRGYCVDIAAFQQQPKRSMSPNTK